MSRSCFPDLPRKPIACFDSRVEKSSCAQRLGVESNTFLHDRQTCVIVMRGLFMGNALYSWYTLSSVKKWGIRMKMAFGSRFIGCKVDSREQSFGNTFVSSALLTAVIYKYISETTP